VRAKVSWLPLKIRDQRRSIDQRQQCVVGGKAAIVLRVTDKKSRTRRAESGEMSVVCDGRHITLESVLSRPGLREIGRECESRNIPQPDRRGSRVGRTKLFLNPDVFTYAPKGYGSGR
jgi:hypothetical protein